MSLDNTTKDVFKGRGYYDELKDAAEQSRQIESSLLQSIPKELSDLTPEVLKVIWGNYLIWRIDSINTRQDTREINMMLGHVSSITTRSGGNDSFPRVALKIDMLRLFGESDFARGVADAMVAYRPDAGSLDEILNSVSSAGFKLPLEK